MMPNYGAKYRRPLFPWSDRRLPRLRRNDDWLCYLRLARLLDRNHNFSESSPKQMIEVQAYGGHVELNTSLWKSTNTRDYPRRQRQPTRPSYLHLPHDRQVGKSHHDICGVFTANRFPDGQCLAALMSCLVIFSLRGVRDRGVSESSAPYAFGRRDKKKYCGYDTKHLWL